VAATDELIEVAVENACSGLELRIAGVHRLFGQRAGASGGETGERGFASIADSGCLEIGFPGAMRRRPHVKQGAKVHEVRLDGRLISMKSGARWWRTRSSTLDGRCPRLDRLGHEHGTGAGSDIGGNRLALRLKAKAGFAQVPKSHCRGLTTTLSTESPTAVQPNRRFAPNTTKGTARLLYRKSVISMPSPAMRARASGPAICSMSTDAAHKISTIAPVNSLLFQTAERRGMVSDAGTYGSSRRISNMTTSPFLVVDNERCL
jgi:hypothetical protein